MSSGAAIAFCCVILVLSVLDLEGSAKESSDKNAKIKEHCQLYIDDEKCVPGEVCGQNNNEFLKFYNLCTFYFYNCLKNTLFEKADPSKCVGAKNINEDFWKYVSHGTEIPLR